MLNAGRQVLAFIAVTAAAIAVVDVCSRTSLFPVFRYPGGAVLIYGLSMSLVWLMRHVVPFAFPPRCYRPRPFEIDGRLYWLLLANIVANVYPIMLQRHNRARLLPVLEKLAGRDRR